VLWAVWHLPDHFAEEGWGVEALISAPIVFAVEFVSLFLARALFVWFYNVTAFSVLLVAIFQLRPHSGPCCGSAASSHQPLPTIVR
jgi:hypothetical protein